MMTEVRFYHFTRQSYEEILPVMLERVISRDRKRAVVKVSSEDMLDHLNTHLCIFSDRSFLPHGTKKEGSPEIQPIWLTNDDENPNNAHILFLIDGCSSDKIDEYEMVCLLVNGRDNDSLAAGRKSWSLYKEQGHQLNYWQQSDKGIWEIKDI